MCRLGSIAVFLAVFTVVPLAAQDEGPHVYVVTYIKAKPDRAAEYSRYWNEILGPLYDEFVKHEDMVSYHMLGQWPGIGPYSHVLLVEWVNWDAMHDGLTDLGSESWEAACQAAHGMTWAEAMEEVDLTAMRDIIGREIYESVRP